jgi:Fe-S-cluster containining protein
VSLALKKALLKTLYAAYDKIVEPFEVACRIECSLCCTHNVLATTLEAALVIDALEQPQRAELLSRARRGTEGKRLQPILTTNALAEFCLKRRDPPAEDPDFEMRPCPLREPDGCPIYPVRPFGCRSLFSSEICKEGGEAAMHPILVALNGVFGQLIEHIDRGGLYGNLIDLLLVLGNEERGSAYESCDRIEPVPPLLANRPNPGFLILPGEREEIRKALNFLLDQEVGGLSFAEAMRSLRTGGNR